MEETTKLAEELTQGTLDVFTAYAEDAGNWGGTPLIDGNVRGSREQNGHLTDLKKKDFITTFDEYEPGCVVCTWINFTEKGEALAKELGIEIY